MKYKIGQKVVYIGPDFRSHPLLVLTRAAAPAPRAVLTIRGGRVMPSGEPGYVFDEIINPVRLCLFSGVTAEMHVNEQFLRPLQERKNDGEAFVAGLRPLLEARISRLVVPISGGGNG